MTYNEKLSGCEAGRSNDKLGLLPITQHDHPEPQTMVWSELELHTIRVYAARCVAAERERWVSVQAGAHGIGAGVDRHPNDASEDDPWLSGDDMMGASADITSALTGKTRPPPTRQTQKPCAGACPVQQLVRPWRRSGRTVMNMKTMVCGVDCKPRDCNCNGYCEGKAPNPPDATESQKRLAARKIATDALTAAERAWYEFASLCEVGVNRTRAFAVYENLRNSRRL